LKGVGLDMLSFGRIEAEDGDRAIADRDGTSNYRKVVISDGRVVGGVFLGFGDDAQQALDARDSGRVISEDDVDRMVGGDWSVLDDSRTPV
jgi:NAD(P)H-nitrite reductase large subunit